MVSLDLPAAGHDRSYDNSYVEPLFSWEYGKLLLADTRHVFTAPLHWDRGQWIWFGGAAAGLTAMVLLDKPFSEFVERNHNSTTDTISRNIDPFGGTYSFGVLGAFYVGGLLFKNSNARAVAQDGLAATIIASGIISPAMKYTFGRARHDEQHGAYDFDFFSLHDNSFPSGHTTQAFAVASVIAAHYDSIWVKGSAYAVASLVGYARIQQNRHWGTDVAVGALIGTLVGDSVVHFNQARRAAHGESSASSFIPLIGGDTVGIMYVRRF